MKVDDDVCDIPNTSIWEIQSMLIGKGLGQGGFASVYLAKHKKNGFIVALKVIERDKIKKKHLENQIRDEYLIQSSLNHDNIIKIYAHFCDNARIFFVMEYASGGDLYQELKKNGTFSEDLLHPIIKDVALGLQYCHSEHVIHRDIKPDNILLSLERRCKITDFGLAVKLNHDEKYATGFVGTIDYVSPEIIKHSKCSYSTDVWSFGVLIYELLVGKTPFDDDVVQKTYEKITNVQFKMPDDISSDIKVIIKKMLVKDPTQRMTLEQLLSYSFIK